MSMSKPLFIAVEVDASIAGDHALAAKLAEVCPVDIFHAGPDGVEIVDREPRRVRALPAVHPRGARGHDAASQSCTRARRFPSDDRGAPGRAGPRARPGAKKSRMSGPNSPSGSTNGIRPVGEQAKNVWTDSPACVSGPPARRPRQQRDERLPAASTRPLSPVPATSAVRASASTTAGGDPPVVADHEIPDEARQRLEPAHPASSAWPAGAASARRRSSTTWPSAQHEHQRNDREQRAVAAGPVGARALRPPEGAERGQHHADGELHRVLGHARERGVDRDAGERDERHRRRPPPRRRDATRCWLAPNVSTMNTTSRPSRNTPLKRS